MLSSSLCTSDIKLQKKGRKKLGFDGTDLFPLLGVRRGRGRVLAWVLTASTSCVWRNEEMFIPKQSSTLEFNGLPSPLAFNFCCVLSPLSLFILPREGREESRAERVWNHPYWKQNLRYSPLKHRRATICSQSSQDAAGTIQHPEEAQQLPNPWPQSPSAMGT